GDDDRHVGRVQHRQRRHLRPQRLGGSEQRRSSHRAARQQRGPDAHTCPVRGEPGDRQGEELSAAGDGPAWHRAGPGRRQQRHCGVRHRRRRGHLPAADVVDDHVVQHDDLDLDVEHDDELVEHHLDVEVVLVVVLDDVHLVHEQHVDLSARRHHEHEHHRPEHDLDVDEHVLVEQHVAHDEYEHVVDDLDVDVSAWGDDEHIDQLDHHHLAHDLDEHLDLEHEHIDVDEHVAHVADEQLDVDVCVHHDLDLVHVHELEHADQLKPHHTAT